MFVLHMELFWSAIHCVSGKDVFDFFRFKFFVFVLSCICVFVQAAGAGRKTRGLEFKANKQEQCQFFFALIASSVMLQTGSVEKAGSLS